MFEPLYKSIREIIRSFYKEVLNLEHLHLKSQSNKKILHKGNTIYGLSNKIILSNNQMLSSVHPEFCYSGKESISLIPALQKDTAKSQKPKPVIKMYKDLRRQMYRLG